MKRLLAVGLLGAFLGFGFGFGQVSPATAETTPVAPMPYGMMGGMPGGMMGNGQAGWMGNMMASTEARQWMNQMMGGYLDTPEGEAMLDACSSYWNSQNKQGRSSQS